MAGGADDIERQRRIVVRDQSVGGWIQHTALERGIGEVRIPTFIRIQRYISINCQDRPGHPKYNDAEQQCAGQPVQGHIDSLGVHFL